MKAKPTLNVTQVQRQLPRLIKRDRFAISRYGKIVGFYLSKERLGAFIETAELLGNPEFLKALDAVGSGKTKFYEINDLDKEMSA